MKFSLTAALTGISIAALAATSAFAQKANIGAPTDMSSFSPGSNVTVTINRPDTQSPSDEVAIVIGIVSCASSSSGGCPGPNNDLGTILYNGPFNPSDANSPGLQAPHENYTITIPDTIGKGVAQLGVVHVALVGAGLTPFLGKIAHNTPWPVFST